MKIIIKPSDLIKRFIWDKYKHFCLYELNAVEITEIIENDKEFEISENDAFVIGLTNVIYTDEVIYKFKQYIKEILENKSHMQDTRLYIPKDIILQGINLFKLKIPKNWVNNDFEFNRQLNELNNNIYSTFIEYLDQLEITKIQDYDCVKHGQVKKIINKL